MSRQFFRAMGDFAFVNLPLDLRAVAIFLIFASPVLATLYFSPMLDHFVACRAEAAAVGAAASGSPHTTMSAFSHRIDDSLPVICATLAYAGECFFGNGNFPVPMIYSCKRLV